MKKSTKSDSNPDSDTFRTFGELNSVLKNETTVDLAKKLIGVNLCRRIDGMKIIGKIVETEGIDENFNSIFMISYISIFFEVNFTNLFGPGIY